jgi:hypothetical protein
MLTFFLEVVSFFSLLAEQAAANSENQGSCKGFEGFMVKLET